MRLDRKLTVALLIVALAGAVDPSEAKKGKKTEKQGDDPYPGLVWPEPPAEPRIKLDRIISGRGDVEAKSGFGRKLIALAKDSPYDLLQMPHDVAFDAQGRILVTDKKAAALLRFDRENRVMDVFGTKSTPRLQQPMGLDVGPQGTIYVGDSLLHRVVAFDGEGGVVRTYGAEGELENPVGVAVAPDGERLFVADAATHRLAVFELATGNLTDYIGKKGGGEGQFAWPGDLAFGPEGNLFVVDQLNARIQMLDADGNYLDAFGDRGMGFGQFNRPKGIAVDEVGFIYVTDYRHENLQLFDVDFSLLTFIGRGGAAPGEFFGATGVAVRGDEFAVVDQNGGRIQLFRFLIPKNQ